MGQVISFLIYELSPISTRDFLILELKGRLVIWVMLSFLHQFIGGFCEACSFPLPAKGSVLLSALSIWISDWIVEIRHFCSLNSAWRMLHFFPFIPASRLSERKHISPSFSVMIMTWRLMPLHVNPACGKHQTGQMDKRVEEMEVAS